MPELYGAFKRNTRPDKGKAGGVVVAIDLPTKHLPRRNGGFFIDPLNVNEHETAYCGVQLPHKGGTIVALN